MVQAPSGRFCILELFPGNGLLDGLHDVGRPQAVGVHQERLGAHLVELVLLTNN